MNDNTQGKIRSPWFWVPSIFFMQGLPGIWIIMVLGIMYKNFGMSNTDITLYTGMLITPYVIKPIWASFVDIVKTKRWWIYTMEIIIGGLFICLALSLHTPMVFQVSLAICWAMAFLGSTHDIASDGYYVIELKSEQQAFFLGIQTASYNIGRVFIQGIMVMLAGILFAKIQDWKIVWMIILLIAAAVCIVLGIYNKLILPQDVPCHESKRTFKAAIKEFIEVYIEFFKIEHLVFAILFLLLYRFGETLLSGGIIPLFLLDPISKGGLGLNNQFTGLSYGVIAPIVIILGGLLGGFAIYKFGFNKMKWWMLLAINIPNAMYVYLAYAQPSSRLFIASCIAIEQFFYAFSLGTYNMFLMYAVRNSRFKTAHYAFFAGVMLLGNMIPKMLSGWMQEYLGYEEFFIVVLFMIIPGAIVVKYLKVEKDFGKKALKNT